jgi:hypothetical protein
MMPFTARNSAELEAPVEMTAAAVMLAPLGGRRLALDHGGTTADGVARLPGKLWWSNVSVGLLPERFTMSRARRVFEASSGARCEPSSFQRELDRSGRAQATGLVAKAGLGQLAALYELMSRQAAWSLRRARPPVTLGTVLAREMARR